MLVRARGRRPTKKKRNIRPLSRQLGFHAAKASCLFLKNSQKETKSKVGEMSVGELSGRENVLQFPEGTFGESSVGEVSGHLILHQNEDMSKRTHNK